MELGAIDDPVPFDFGVAATLVRACRSAVSSVDTQVGQRYSFVHTGSTNLKGHFSQLFAQNALTASADATELAMSLRAMADAAERLAQQAREEQDRRNKAKAWVAEQKARSNWDKLVDWATDGSDPPVGPPSTPIPHRHGRLEPGRHLRCSRAIPGAGAVVGKAGVRVLAEAMKQGAISGSVGGAMSGAHGYVRQPGPHSVSGFVGHTALGAGAGAGMGAAGGAAGHGLLRLTGAGSRTAAREADGLASSTLGLIRPQPTVPEPVTSQATNKIYSARVLKRMADEPGPYHNFPESFDA